MGDPLTSSYIEAVTKRVFPMASNNRFAMSECVKRLLDLALALTVEEFAFIRSGINGGDVARDDEWQRLPGRLELLSHRLEDEGRYVDANIAHMAFEALAKSTAARTDVQAQQMGAAESAELRAPVTATSTIEAGGSLPAGTQVPPVDTSKAEAAKE